MNHSAYMRQYTDVRWLWTPRQIPHKNNDAMI